MPFSFRLTAILFNEACLVAAPALSGAKMGDLVKWLGRLDSAHLCFASRLNESWALISFTQSIDYYAHLCAAERGAAERR
jgi:hypothetical protein